MMWQLKILVSFFLVLDSTTCYAIKPTPLCLDPNEVYNLEKPSCPSDECSSLVAKFDCTKFPPPSPGCECTNGYKRINSSSPCIPVCQCPQMLHAPQCTRKPILKPKCTGPYEVYNAEKPAPECRADECASLVSKFRCTDFLPSPGCECGTGYKRIEPSSPCVPVCQCPEMKYSPQCAGKTESD